MKIFLSLSILNQVLTKNETSERLVHKLEEFLNNHDKYYTSALSLFEVMDKKEWLNHEDKQELLNQSGILCEEIYPVTQDDLQLYNKLGKEINQSGLFVIELALAINRGMDVIFTWDNRTESKWIRIQDLSEEVSNTDKP